MLRPKTTANIIGINIKLIRKKSGLIQKQVGGNKIPASIISRIENGKFIPKVSMLETICKALGCKSSDILPF